MSRLLAKVIVKKHKAEEHLASLCPSRKEVDQVRTIRKGKQTVLLWMGIEEALGW